MITKTKKTTDRSADKIKHHMMRFQKIKFLIFPLILSVWMLLVVNCSVARSSSEKKEEIATHLQTSEHHLDNGLTVLLTEMPANPMISVYALVKTGSATEDQYLGSGISHLLEHLFFKGTTHRKVGQIPEEIKAVGGTINASTGKDHTIFTITVPADQYQTALNVLSDMLMNPSFEENEFNKERQVVLNELRMYKDNPDRYLSDLSFRNIYHNHPYRHPIIGYEPLFVKLTRDDVIAYFKQRYAANNMILSVAGSFEPDTMFRDIQKVFKDFPMERPYQRKINQEPPPNTPRIYEEEFPTDLTRVIMAYNGVRLLDKDLFALDVLANILGQGRSSRLYQDVYQTKELVYSISAYNYTPVDTGFFEVAFTCENEKTEEVEEAVLEQIEEIKAKGVTSAELKKAQKEMISDHIFGLQTTDQVAHAFAVNLAFAGDPLFDQYYVNQIQNVTSEDIRRVADKYLNPSTLILTILKPEEAKEKDTLLNESVADHDIHKYKLSDNVTVLLKEDHALPLVSIRLSLKGGRRMENENISGMSELMSAVWIKGTKTRSAEMIAKDTESRGIRLDSYSGLNSFGLSLNLLSQDIDFGFDLFEDLILNANFPPEEIAKTKDDLKAALLRYKDNIFQFSFQELKKRLYPDHPAGLVPEGTVDSLNRIDSKDVLSFYKKLVVPENMVISVFGDINEDEVLGLLTKKFSSLKNRSLPSKFFPVQPITAMVKDKVYLDKKQAFVAIGFHAVDLYSPDRYKIEVLTSLLGSSFNGRLFEAVRESGAQAYSVGGQFTLSMDTGYVIFYALTNPDQVESVQKTMFAQIKKIQDEGVSEQELKDMQTYLIGQFKSSLQKMDDEAFTSSLNEAYGLGYDYDQQYETLIRQVTVDDIRQVAQQFFNPDQGVAVVVGPAENQETETEN